jgi:glutathione S-transferase
MRTLYHFQNSPFSRRTRLALAHKGLACDLREGRTNPSYGDEARALWPLRTCPILVEDDGHAIGDSTAIARYLDAAYPDSPRLWPTDRDSARDAGLVATLVDGALDRLVDVGTRYFALHHDPAWLAVRDEQVGRAQASLDALAGLVVASKTVTEHGFCAPDMWLFTAVAWLEALPARAAESPNVAQILTLPWKLPAALSAWAAPFKGRKDVQSL